MAMEDQALFFSSRERVFIVTLTWMWNAVNIYQIAEQYVWPVILARRRARADARREARELARSQARAEARRETRAEPTLNREPESPAVEALGRSLRRAAQMNEEDEQMAAVRQRMIEDREDVTPFDMMMEARRERVARGLNPYPYGGAVWPFGN